MKRIFLSNIKTLALLCVLFVASGFAAAQSAPLNRTEPIIVWWTNTSAPPWYEGKALPSTGSTVTVYAIPGTGYGASAKNLTYTWNINAEPQPKISGIGKQTFTIAVSQAENVVHQVSVRVSSPEGTVKKESTLLLQTEQPRLFVYSLLPTGGIASQNAVTNFSGASGETYDFTAVPFFFRPDQLALLKYVWHVNGTDFLNVDKPRIFSITTDPNETYGASIAVETKGGQKTSLLPQEASSFFSVSIR